jgi:hypothetical protein
MSRAGHWGRTLAVVSKDTKRMRGRLVIRLVQQGEELDVEGWALGQHLGCRHKTRELGVSKKVEVLGHRQKT